MHFGIIEKLTMDCISLNNNAGLIAKVSEEIANKNIEIAVVKSHCHLTPLPKEPHKYLHKRYIDGK